MALLHHALIFSLLVSTTLAYTHSLPALSPLISPAASPLPSHHHHHPGHGHHKTLSPPPAKPPTTYPSPPPAHPPVKPPTPPVKPPVVLPPTKPPTPPVKPPTYPPPVKPPTAPPAKPPTPPVKPPVKPPVGPLPRKYVAVQGVVYCKSCNYTGVDTLVAASPLPGAKVVLRCRNTKYLLRQTATTDKNGYFFIEAPQQITTYGIQKCHVYLPKKTKLRGPCTKPTNLNGGVLGAVPTPAKPTAKPSPFALYTVGPFAYEGPKCYKH